MPSINLVDATLPGTDITTILAALDGIRDKLPFLVDLTPEERQRRPKFSDETQGFALLALDAFEQNPDAFPAAFDGTAFGKDLALLDALSSVRMAVAQLHEHVEDTHLQLKSEAYQDALYVYRQVQTTPAGQALDGLAAQLGLRFARRPRPAPGEDGGGS